MGEFDGFTVDQLKGMVDLDDIARMRQEAAAWGDAGGLFVEQTARLRGAVNVLRTQWGGPAAEVFFAELDGVLGVLRESENIAISNHLAWGDIARQAEETRVEIGQIYAEYQGAWASANERYRAEREEYLGLGGFVDDLFGRPDAPRVNVVREPFDRRARTAMETAAETYTYQRRNLQPPPEYVPIDPGRDPGGPLGGGGGGPAGWGPAPPPPPPTSGGPGAGEEPPLVGAPAPVLPAPLPVAPGPAPLPSVPVQPPIGVAPLPPLAPPPGGAVPVRPGPVVRPGVPRLPLLPPIPEPSPVVGRPPQSGASPGPRVRGPEPVIGRRPPAGVGGEVPPGPRGAVPGQRGVAPGQNGVAPGQRGVAPGAGRPATGPRVAEPVVGGRGGATAGRGSTPPARRGPELSRDGVLRPARGADGAGRAGMPPSGRGRRKGEPERDTTSGLSDDELFRVEGGVEPVVQPVDPATLQPGPYLGGRRRRR